MVTEMTEILPRLFLGDRYAAERLGLFVPPGWHCISVTEYDGRGGRKDEIPNEPYGAARIPFMNIPDKYTRRSTLDDIVVTIDAFLDAGKKVLVHCVQSKERSPLVIAWYLMRKQHAATLDAAYDRVCELHPRTERRISWVQ